MLEVKPLQSKIEQEAACLRCGVEYAADYLAYAAYADGIFSCICQFKLNGDCGIIKDLRATEGNFNPEALYLTGRAALSFMDLCGIHRAQCKHDAADEEIILKVGFIKNDDESYCIKF